MYVREVAHLPALLDLAASVAAGDAPVQQHLYVAGNYCESLLRVLHHERVQLLDERAHLAEVPDQLVVLALQRVKLLVYDAMLQVVAAFARLVSSRLRLR